MITVILNGIILVFVFPIDIGFIPYFGFVKSMGMNFVGFRNDIPF